MKKALFAISALAVAFGFTACSSDDEALNNVQEGKKITVSAFTETSTRTALEDDGEGAYDVIWSTDDKITIGGKEFTLTEGEGKTAAKFSGTAPADGEYTAYYATTDGKVPTKQVYKAGEISNFPMTADATVSGGEVSALHFKNVGGLLQLTVVNNGSESYDLAGFTFNAAGLAKPYTLVCEDLEWAELDDEIVFNLALPEGEYTNVVITLYDSEYRTCVKTLKSGSLKIERSKITKASFSLKEEVNFSYPENITWNSPVGTVGMIDGRVGIVTPLKIGVDDVNFIIAAKNEGAKSMTGGVGSTDYNADCYGTYMTRSEANVYHNSDPWAKDGWILPRAKTKATSSNPDIPAAMADAMTPWYVKGVYVGHKIDVTDMVKVYFPAAGLYHKCNYEPANSNYTGQGANGFYTISKSKPNTTNTDNDPVYQDGYYAYYNLNLGGANGGTVVPANFAKSDNTYDWDWCFSVRLIHN